MAENIPTPQPEGSLIQTPKNNNQMLVMAIAVVFIVLVGGLLFWAASKRQSTPAKVQYQTQTVTVEPTLTSTPENKAADIDEANSMQIESPDADLTDIQKDLNQL